MIKIYRMALAGVLLALLATFGITATATAATTTTGASSASSVSTVAKAAALTPNPDTITPDVNGTVEFYNWNTANCIDDSSGFGLRMYGCNTSSYNSGYQKWWYGTYAGYYYFENAKTLVCLDDSLDFGLRVYSCTGNTGNNHQLWYVNYSETIDGSTFYQWKNVQTGLCLDSSAAYGLRGYTCNLTSFNEGYQAWLM